MTFMVNWVRSLRELGACFFCSSVVSQKRSISIFLHWEDLLALFHLFFLNRWFRQQRHKTNMASFSLNDIHKLINEDILECELCYKRFYGMTALVGHICRTISWMNIRTTRTVTVKGQLFEILETGFWFFFRYRKPSTFWRLLSGACLIEVASSFQFFFYLLNFTILLNF